MKEPKRLTLASFKERVTQCDCETYLGEGFIISTRGEIVTKASLGDGDPYRVNGFAIALYVEGEAKSTVNLKQEECKKGTLQYFSSGSLFQQTYMSDDAKIACVVVQSDMLTEIIPDNTPLPYQRLAYNFNTLLPERDQNIIRSMVQALLCLLKTETEQSNSVRCMLASLLHYVSDIILRNDNQTDSTSSHQRLVFRDFVSLLNESHGRERRLSNYADKLCVSEHYLSLAVKHVSGTTAKEWIDNAVVAEIKVLLRHTTLSISQITDKLSFPNDSFLCKFFKRHTGYSPMKYRKGV